MYKVIATDEEFLLRRDNGRYYSRVKPIKTLADEWGGRCQIYVDDHCFVLALLHDGTYLTTPYIFEEAWEALMSMNEEMLR